MGKISMGTFLELGSERDLGTHYMAGIFTLYPPEIIPTQQRKTFVFFTYICFCMSADVLVGNKLPSVCS
jgi:hypothetical protein